MAQNFQVVIVGAGLSGLRAAREVHNAGLSYIVLEAMDRVRGKTLSVQASDGHGVVDLGASWINDTSQSEIYRLAKEFGFDLVEQRTEGNSLYGDEMGQVQNPHRVLVFPLKGPNLRDYAREASTIVRRSAAKQLLQALKTLHDGGMVHRDRNSANVMFGLSSFETGADLTTKYQILGRPQKIELPRDQETWKDGELVAPMTPKDSFVVQNTITLGDFELAIRSDTGVDFKLQVPVGYCAPERKHQINPTFASDMWSYMCIFAGLYLKWPLFGSGFFGGGFRSVAGLLVRVLGPLPLSWKVSYDGGGEPDESWYDQSKVLDTKMSLQSRVTQSRDTVEPAEQQLVLSILRQGFSYLPEERLSAGELLQDASFKALMDRYGV